MIMNDNDDLISRQALKQAMYSAAFELDSDMQKWDGGCWIRYRLFEKIIDIMPPVQPQQKTATFYVDSEGYERCSACNEHESGMRYFNFCPNCGAKMESEDRNEDSKM